MDFKFAPKEKLSKTAYPGMNLFYAVFPKEDKPKDLDDFKPSVRKAIVNRIIHNRNGKTFDIGCESAIPGLVQNELTSEIFEMYFSETQKHAIELLITRTEAKLKRATEAYENCKGAIINQLDFAVSALNTREIEEKKWP